jgi:hypothetical protein
MTIETAGVAEARVSGQPDILQQSGFQTQDQASGTTVLITEAEVALGSAAAMGVRRKDRRWVALLNQIFAPVLKASRPKRRPYPPRMAYLEDPRMAREMARL